jgi:hypothetical protein
VPVIEGETEGLLRPEELEIKLCGGGSNALILGLVSAIEAKYTRFRCNAC